MPLCLISANCQGVPLIRQMYAFLPFSKHYKVEYYVNFKKETIPPEKLKSCNLLIYQKLSHHWGELSETYLLEHVNPSAKTVCMPNIVNNAFWPISKGTGDLSNPYNETYVDELMQRKLTVSEIMYLVKRVDFSRYYDLQALFDKSLQIERDKNYARGQEICDYIENTFREKMLFTTFNHPYGTLLNLIAKSVLEEIGYRGVPDVLIPDLVCEEEYYMPVPPSVARFFNMSFIDENTRYPVYGNRLTYYEYIYHYVIARQNDIPLAHYFMYLAKKT